MVRRVVLGLIGGLVAVCTLGALLGFYPLVRDFDTVHVRLEFASRDDTPGGRLDAVLLDALDHFAYLRAFDHVFAAGDRRARIDRPVWLDRCEVRQGDFQRFAQWLPFNTESAPVAPGQPAGWRHLSDTWDHAVSGRLAAPANGITWYDAWAYCAASGGRLPHVDEWIAAATGTEQRLYPWGDDFLADGWPYLDPLLNAARTCGEQPRTDTPGGIADMGQNVAEWTVGDGSPPAPLVAGGNGYNAPREVYSLAILYRHAPATYRSPYLGFRCAYDAPPVTPPWRAVPQAVVLPVGDYRVGVPDGARLPGLLAHMPRERLDLVARMFERPSASGARHRPAVVDLHVTAREITRRDYAAFLNDPFVAAGFHADANQPREHSHRPPDWGRQMTEPDLPVVNVDWWSAHAFASWAGGRLPSAEEWESAASGQGRHPYPWGDDYIETTTPDGGGVRTIRVVLADDPDATPEGLLAMGGNVSEWTRSVSSAGGRYSVVVKGGNYLLPGAETARMDFRNHVSPNHRSPTLGFRVVFDRPR